MALALTKKGQRIVCNFMTKMSEHWANCEVIAQKLGVKKNLIHLYWYKLTPLIEQLLSEPNVSTLAEAKRLLYTPAVDEGFFIGETLFVRSAIVAIGPGPLGSVVYLISGEALDIDKSPKELQDWFLSK